MFKQQLKTCPNRAKFKRKIASSFAYKQRVDQLQRRNLEVIVDNSILKFKRMRIRLKMSFMAFAKNLTVKELILHALLDTYYQRFTKNHPGYAEREEGERLINEIDGRSMKDYIMAKKIEYKAQG